MRVTLIFLFLFFIGMHAFGQIKYERGYFINKDNQRIECLIKNMDWKNNPKDFIYKLGDNATPENGNLASMREFGIYNYCKFINADVKLDRSSNNIRNLTTEKDPVWSQEKLFLKVILEGRVTLYYYEEPDLHRFFYSITDSIIQLIYKRYVTGIAIVENNRFRQQLWANFNCDMITIDYVENTHYTLKDFEEYFRLYSDCFFESVTEISHKVKRNYFNMKLTPGLNLSSVSATYSPTSKRDVSFEKNVNPRLGIEFEFVLPYNRNKWAIVLEPTFQYFNSQEKLADETAIIRFSSIEFPLGVRYYSIINDNLKLYFNGFWISNFSLNIDSRLIFNSNINFKNVSTYDISYRNSFALGAGFNYSRLGLEIRYYAKREILSDYLAWTSNYSRWSVILGYKIIK